MNAIPGLGGQKLSSPLALPTRFGRYRLTRLLAIGGMAQIYLAKAFGAEGFVKRLVIKRLNPDLAENPHFTSLFINEAKLLVALNHGNIVPVFDFGRVGGDLFMAMEYIPGVSLRKMLQALHEAGRTLEYPLAAHVATEVCKGLDYAHRKSDEYGRPAGIIHRDIKPTNILISFEGEVKIVDFGVAKLAGRMETGGMLTGTLAYMSPEQAERQAVDPRTDVFSAGLVLYEMVAGHRAYECELALDMLAMARRADIPTLPEEAPRELREVIERATRREPTKRFGSAHEMEQALSEYLLLARSAGTTMDSVSPASKLSALMKGLPFAPQEMFSTEEDLEDDDEAFDEEDVLVEEVSGLQDGTMLEPPDLGLIRDAAETFHSEFMTRVLMEEQVTTESRRRWIVGAGVGLLLVAAGIVAYLLLVGPGVGTGAGGGATVARGRAAVADAAGPKAVATADGSGRTPTDLGWGIAVELKEGGVGAPDLELAPDAGRRRRRPRHGYLNINSFPWSNVTIDGRRYKRPTPLLHIRLRTGRHTVVLENREQNLRKVLKVWIRPGVTTWKVVRLR
jgi:serine/threonine protein kinase